MTDVYDLARTCTAKKRYPTETVALDIAKKIARDRGVQLRVYACDQGCGGFHLTKQRANYVSPKPGWRRAKIIERQRARDAARRRSR